MRNIPCRPSLQGLGTLASWLRGLETRRGEVARFLLSWRGWGVGSLLFCRAFLMYLESSFFYLFWLRGNSAFPFSLLPQLNGQGYVYPKGEERGNLRSGTFKLLSKYPEKSSGKKMKKRLKWTFLFKEIWAWEIVYRKSCEPIAFIRSRFFLTVNLIILGVTEPRR